VSKNIGMWMYQNGGGTDIEKKMLSKLNERDIKAHTNLNLRYSYTKNGQIFIDGFLLNDLDLFFSYNAGEQTQYQMYMYKILNTLMPMVNNYEAFHLTEDKFQTSFTLKQNDIASTDFKLCHRDDAKYLKKIMKEWKKMVYKPVDG